MNGKDIKKVMDNALFIFDEFAKILVAGKRPGCTLGTAEIEAKCGEYRTAFLLWDGAFSYARKINPTSEDIAMYERFAKAAVKQHSKFCSITHKVHLMFKHVAWQMKNIPGGLGDKMEDWVELAHQLGARMRTRFRSVKDPLTRAIARERARQRDTDPEVVAYIDGVDERARREFKVERVSKAKVDKETREKRRKEELDKFEAAQAAALATASEAESRCIECSDNSVEKSS